MAAEGRGPFGDQQAVLRGEAKLAVKLFLLDVAGRASQQQFRARLHRPRRLGEKRSGGRYFVHHGERNHQVELFLVAVEGYGRRGRYTPLDAVGEPPPVWLVA